jgi:hypothetical protein
MPTPQGATARTLLNLTIGSQKAMRAREQRDREMGLSEIMQHFQIGISGVAATGWGFAQATIAFEFPFYYAPGQRDPDFPQPQFWFGAEAGAPVAVSAVVGEWIADEDNGATIGAKVWVGVQAAVVGVAYDGVLHLTFQGFSALSEDEVDFADVGLT